MIKNNVDKYLLMAKIGRSFSDPNRLIILEELKSGEKRVGKLALACGISQPLVSRHLNILRSNGSIKSRRERNSVYYILANDKISMITDLLQKILVHNLERQISETVKVEF